jgi:hypothetical protein
MHKPAMILITFTEEPDAIHWRMVESYEGKAVASAMKGELLEIGTSFKKFHHTL